MDLLLLSRLQFAATTVFHFFFVPITIGMVFLIAIFETMYVRTGDDHYKRITKFFGHLFLINFAVGVVTGILQEFQFGMNWSEYSSFVGDVFGPSLAVEALLAFYLESTFIGIWIFSWEKINKKLHAMCIWLVSIGTMLSAFWILSANSFMQRPVGFKIVENSVIGKKAEMIDFWAIATNSYLWNQFPHVIFTSLTVGAFVIAGIAAWKINRKHEIAMFRKAFKVSIVAALIGSAGLLWTGHSQMQYLVREYPMKVAAAEALYEDSEDPAPFTVLASINEKQQETKPLIEVPGLLSFLSYDKFEGSLKGMKTLQKELDEKYYPVVGEHLNYIPEVTLIFYTFRMMSGSGALLFIIALLGTIYAFRKTEVQKSWYLKMLPWTILIAEVATASGWIMAEMGRQPFIIFGIMPTSAGVSPISAEAVLFSLIVFCALYTILGIAQFVLFRYMMKKKESSVKEVA
ncbi:cytochrome ubiquinol oxidase subunit I [Gemelliphila palaticanis]|uniref:Cytochrome ubiquinol oxidase subunit I n=1 Tax=Gemelliphila palaticanis TaxID=81950 RepID=A0ABX2SYF3_9BACL|nr:cytochrome ubiquinol oxidase subunit I [Gemella palaticanis]MBF0715294.1 cytochrome ubiquinol oxidase subunit I [Gemella palaticanis]NYS47224.1 cytochrome ubiquinol oxidase subunit I [Gemella palaticanis]